MYTITADSSANIPLLKKLEKEGIVKYYFINLENAKENALNGRKGWENNIPAVAVLDVSTLNGGDVLGSSDEGEIWNELKKVLGGGRSNLNDRRQLSNHFYSRHDIFVTGDKGDIIYHAKRLAELGMVVLHNDQLEEYVRKPMTKN